jgi:cob(I)alamin adenosyltransferase
VIVNDGDGKGKSRAAFGTALRAVGHGQRVGLVQFIKGTWRTGEAELFKRLPEIDHVISGEGFTWNTQDRARDVAAARRGLEAARAMIDACRTDPPKYSLVILDEINIVIGHGYLPVEEIVELFACCWPRCANCRFSKGTNRPGCSSDTRPTICTVRPWALLASAATGGASRKHSRRGRCGSWQPIYFRSTVPITLTVCCQPNSCTSY